MEFKGNLPSGIDPKAHGVPLITALRLFGDPMEIEREWDRRRVLWNYAGSCGQEHLEIKISTFAAALDAIENGRAPPCALSEEFRTSCDELAEVIERRKESIRFALRSGHLRAFSYSLRNRDRFEWIDQSDAADIAKLQKHSDVFVSDLYGIPIENAIKAFCSDDLVAAIDDLERRGVGLGAIPEQWEAECEHARLVKLAQAELAELVVAGKLLASGIAASDLPADPYSRARPAAALNYSLIRLPLPCEFEPEIAKTKQAQEKRGPKPKANWGVECGVIAIEFQGRDFTVRGFKEEVMTRISVKCGIERSQAAVHAETVIAILRRSQNVR